MLDIITQEQTYDFVDYVYQNWKDTKKEVQKKINQILNADRSVQELIAEFQKYYVIDTLVSYHDIWQFMCHYYIERHVEDPEAYGREQWSRVKDGTLLPKEVQPGFRHMDEMPLEIQAAVESLDMKGLKKSEAVIQNLLRIYPSVPELRLTQLAVLLDEKRYQQAADVIAPLENQYPDDVELLRLRLVIYASFDSGDRLVRAVEMCDRRLRKSGTVDAWLMLYQGAMTLAEKKRDKTAFSKLLPLTEYPGRMKVEKYQKEALMVYYQVSNFPAAVIEDEMMYLLVRFFQLLDRLMSKGVDLNQPPLVEMIGQSVINISRKLKNPLMREPFVLLLDGLKQRGVLCVDGYQQILDSGYISLETYRFNDEKLFPQDIKDDLFCLYNDEKLSNQEKKYLADYFALNTGREDYIKLSYPTLAKRIKKLKNEARKLGDDIVLYDHVPKMQPVRRETVKIGRNDPCPCGSGLKYKKCCGKNL